MHFWPNLISIESITMQTFQRFEADTSKQPGMFVFLDLKSFT